MKHGALLLGLCLAPASFAQGAPSFDCAKASSSAEELICADTELAALDQRLSETFAEALAAAEAMSAGAQNAVDDLRATQRGWIGGRDACWKADDLRSCVEAAYLEREGDLVATWFLQEPVNSVTWTCGDTPANEVVTTFFDTALPSVRFERGDSVDVGHLTRTASGARYDGSFGRYIWMKGTEATYRDPDPDGQTFACNLVAEE